MADAGRWALHAAARGSDGEESGGEDAAASRRASARERHSRRRSRSRSRSRERGRSRRHEAAPQPQPYAADGGVDWGAPSLRCALDAAWHTPEDAYPRGSPEHAELLAFIQRLAPLRARQRAQRGAAADADARAKLNVRVRPAHTLPPRRGAYRPPPPPLPAAIEAEYALMLSLFEDFLQKRSFAKLLALAKSKAALPIAPYGDEIVALLRSHRVVVLAADTGAGKSTQLPQFLLRAGCARVAVTQPRRLAATALAARVAHETLHAHGAAVGYKVRFDSAASPATAVVFLTEGVLLRELASDPELSRYDVVVVDEAHERHVSTDLLLGMLKLLSRRRSDLRVVVMSATIDVHKFAAFFDEAPVVRVPGRLHPIRVEWHPPLDAHGTPLRRPSNATAAALAAKSARAGGSTGGPRLDPAPYLRLLQRIDASVPAEERGDALIFLPGGAEIAAVAAALAPYAASSRRWVVLPLHAALPAEAQARVFEAAPSGVRKAILATNVAETSITVDGVRFVVDSGRCKLMKHDAAAGGGALREGWVSAAAAEQRKGRAGRTGPGVCFRLYSAAEFSEFEAHTPPEIQRAPLEGVILQLKALCGAAADAASFPWLDAPDATALRRAAEALAAAGALARHRGDGGALTLTPLGAALAALPCEAAPGKLLLLSALLGAGGTGAAAAAALSVASPLARPLGGGGGGGVGAAARALRGPAEAGGSDTLAAVQLFAAWAAARADASASATRGGSGFDARRWCRARGLDEARLVEIAKLQRQLASAVAPMRLSALDGDASSSDEEAAEAAEGGAANAAARRDGARRAARRELRALQRRRERAHGAGTLRVRDDGFANSDEDGGDDGDEAAAGGGGAGGDAARLRELELALNADLRAAAAAGGGVGGAGSGGVGQDALLRALLLLSLYPRVAVADPRNASRRASEARFATAGAADVALHPSSCLAGADSPDADTAAAPEPGAFVYAFAQLLDTHRPFLLGVTRLPAAALLLAARRVEADASGRRALCDGWALLRFADADAGAAAMATAAALRRQLNVATTCALLRATRRRAKGAALAPPDDAMACDDDDASDDGEEHVTADMPAWAAGIAADARAGVPPPPSADVAARLAAFLARPPACAAVALANAAAVAAQRGPLPGARAAPWLRAGGLLAEASTRAALGATPHLRAHWTCARCGAALIATAAEIDAHSDTCTATLAEAEDAAAHFRPDTVAHAEDAEAAALLQDEGAAPGTVGTKEFACDACGPGRTLWLTPTAWLRHRAAHAEQH